MDDIDSKDVFSKPSFPPDIVDNRFNFTQYIHDDFSTFLQVYLASHPTANINHKMNMVLERAAKNVFGVAYDKSFVKNNELLTNQPITAPNKFRINFMDWKFF